MNINDFLKQHRFEGYIESFEKENINMGTLPELTEGDLRMLGLKLGDIKRLTKLIKQMETKQESGIVGLIRERIKNFPSIISKPLFDYCKDENPKLKLWDICDFVELLLRFIVITSVAKMQYQHGKLNEKVIKQFNTRIEQPTLGKWLGMAAVMAEQDSVDPELKRIVTEVLEPVMRGENEEVSLLKLRNFLAHGGSVSHGVAMKLLSVWQPEFEKLLHKLDYLSKLELIVKDEDRYRLLKGNIDDFHSYHPSVEDKRKLDEFVAQNKDVLLKTHTGLFPLWPLMQYGYLSGEISQPSQNIFVRRGELFLEYTPVGSEDFCQTQSNKEALESFIALFKLNVDRETDKKKGFLIRGFESELLNDAKRFVGRIAEKEKILQAVRGKDDHVLWITGNAGIGKSYLMSAVVKELWEEEKNEVIILPYRFKAGDDRCYRKEFITYMAERLIPWTRNRGNSAEHNPSSYTMNDLTRLLAEVDSNFHIVFIVDGLDELPESDFILAEEICNKLAFSHTTWLCSGRTNVSLNHIFRENNAVFLFQDGVPGMRKEDVQAMIFEKIGPLRRKLIKHEFENGEKVINPFIEKVWRYSRGIPLYVTYVIGDILSNRINRFDELTNQLPPSIYAYHQELVKRCSVGLYQQILPRIISTIGIAKEALSFDVILDILIKQDFLMDNQDAKRIMHESLTYIAPMLKRVSTNEANHDGYILYHSSLLDYLREDDDSKILLYSAEKSLIKLIEIDDLTVVSGSDSYLFRWGISHLLESETVNKQKVFDMLSSYQYMELKQNHQKLDMFIDDLYFGYKAVTDEKDSTPILQAFLRLVLYMHGKNNNKLTIENIHALFVYRDTVEFYEDFLNFAIHEDKNNYPESFQELYPSFLLRLANSKRRHGELTDSSSLLEKSLFYFKEQNNIRELQRVEYDLAYLQYLQGNPKQSFHHFENSKSYASQIKDKVGYHISLCVQAHTAIFDSQHSMDFTTLIEVLEEVLPVFKNAAKLEGNENAKRWIKNVYAHQFKAAYEVGNLALAEKFYGLLMNDKWIIKFKNAFLPDYKARLHILREEYEEANTLFESYLNLAGKRNDTESSAKEYLEYAKNLWRTGKTDKAKLVAETGLACPKHFGNAYYQQPLKDLIKKLEL